RLLLSAQVFLRKKAEEQKKQLEEERERGESPPKNVWRLAGWRAEEQSPFGLVMEWIDKKDDPEWMIYEKKEEKESIRLTSSELEEIGVITITWDKYLRTWNGAVRGEISIESPIHHSPENALEYAINKWRYKNHREKMKKRNWDW